MSSSSIRTLLIDNHDSFTWNLWQLLAEVNGEEPLVVPNDGASWEELRRLDFDNLVISPGPGHPARAADFGLCADAIEGADVPVLGVCLGHQGIALAYGGEIVHSPSAVHGGTSRVRHSGSRLLQGLPQDFEAVRYHSLAVAPQLPDCLRATAWTADDEGEDVLMALEHRELPRFGLQFHPESVLTEHGASMLRHFRDLTHRRSGRSVVSSRVGSGRVRERTADVGARAPDALRNPIRSRKLPYPASRTPEAFSALYGSNDHAFWFDSSRAEPGCRQFSFMGGLGGPCSALVTFDQSRGEITVNEAGKSRQLRQDLFEYLSLELARRFQASEELPFDFNGGFAGYFGYEATMDRGVPARYRSECPDAAFLLADRIVAFDHQHDTAWLVSCGAPELADGWLDKTTGVLQSLASAPAADADAVLTASRLPRITKPGSPLSLHLSRDRSRYLSDIAQCKEWIREGESYELCLTNSVAAPPVADTLDCYLGLRRLNPAPWSAYLRLGEIAVMSASPERFLRICRYRTVEARPIKGTRARGGDAAADHALQQELAHSRKDRAENLMIVDLLRNDLGRVCEAGTIRVTELMKVRTYHTVHQMVSVIEGRLRSEVDAVACVRAAFPGGSMTGAPKERTMRLLQQLEQRPRGIYSGALGYLAFNGTADLNIVIRSLVSTPTQTTMGIGGAIVALSDAEQEFDEILTKARAGLAALLLHYRSQEDALLVEYALRALKASGRFSVA